VKLKSIKKTKKKNKKKTKEQNTQGSLRSDIEILAACDEIIFPLALV
jgi:hypothetical protein